MRLPHSDIMQCFHSLKQSEKKHKSRRNVLCKKGRLQACVTSRRVLVVVNTCNKYPRHRPVNTSIHSVKEEKQEMQ
jgi:hypothetical protein